jgi:hypothetical protein
MGKKKFTSPPASYKRVTPSIRQLPLHTEEEEDLIATMGCKTQQKRDKKWPPPVNKAAKAANAKMASWEIALRTEMMRPILTNLAVLQTARRLWIGSQLLDKCEGHLAKQWKLNEMILEVEDYNTRALDIYGRRDKDGSCVESNTSLKDDPTLPWNFWIFFYIYSMLLTPWKDWIARKNPKSQTSCTTRHKEQDNGMVNTCGCEMLSKNNLKQIKSCAHSKSHACKYCNANLKLK